MLNYKAVYTEACKAYEYVVCDSEGGSSNDTYTCKLIRNDFRII
jgi:hypothetical protein